MMMYVVSFLDRANIGFAKQALESAEGINEHAYALAAGLFFISYSSFGFPSNLILHRIGAKVWISVLMVGWGLLSMATMFVTGPTSFYVLRLLLGVMVRLGAAPAAPAERVRTAPAASPATSSRMPRTPMSPSS